MSVTVNTTDGTQVSVSVNGTNAVSFTTEDTNVNLVEGADISVSVTEKGPKGDVGATGPAGANGPAGPGLVSGGTENQFIQKNSATDYDTKWSAYTLPAADGADGQVLTTNGAATVTFAYPKTIAEDVKNVSGGPLTKGTPVHVTGSVGNLAEVIAADAATNYPAHFVLNEDLADDQEGLGIAIGFINNVDVPDASIYTEGQTVYLGESGGWTTTKPTGANAIQNLGIIIKVNTSGNKISGIIMGAGRANDVPNIATGNIWAGNADGVATATSVAYIDTTNQRVGIGTVTPNLPLHVHLTSSQDTSPSPWYSNGIAVSSPNTYGIRRIGFEGPSRTTGAYIESSAESGSGGQRSYISFTTRSTSASEKMRITSDGNVGIGTASPSEKLHVEGNIRLSNGSTIGVNGGESFNIGKTTGSGAATVTHGGNSTFIGSVTINNSTGLDFGTTSGANSIGANTSSTFFFDKNGSGTADYEFTSNVSKVVFQNNVGIGTTTPEETLHVTPSVLVGAKGFSAPVAGQLRVASPNASYGELGFTSQYDNFPSGIRSYGLSSNYDRDLRFYTKDTASAADGLERMRITESGNVGIGTTSPSARLDSRVDDGNTHSLRLGRTDTSSYWDFIHAGDDLRIYNTGGSGKDILLGVNSGGIDQGNKVGIGTASPSAKLHVADANGEIHIEDTTTSSTTKMIMAKGNVIIGTDQSSTLPSIGGHIKIGGYAGASQVSQPSIAIGSAALRSTTGGSQYNIAIGSSNSRYSAGGNFMTAVGDGANQYGRNYNSVFGYQANQYSTGNYNTVFGAQAAKGVSATSTFSNTTAVGHAALNALTTGASNTAIGYQAGDALTTGGSNTLLGYGSGSALTTTSANVSLGSLSMEQSAGVSDSVAVGHAAMRQSSSSGSVAVGREALRYASATNTTAVGYTALTALTSGARNTGVGYRAGAAITSGGANTLLGYEAGDALVGSTYNVAIGEYALSSASDGSFRVAIGAQALENATAAQASNTIAIGFRSGESSTGNNNVLIGHESGKVNTSGNTTAVGYQALTALTTGAGNTAVGYTSGDAITTGYDNTLLGYNSGGSIVGGYNNTGIGKDTLSATTSGYSNTAVGLSAVSGGVANTGVGVSSLNSVSGIWNTALGMYAGYSLTTENYGTFVGGRSGRYTTGGNNTLIGYESGQGTSGSSTFSNTVAVGYQALTALTTGVENVAVGYQASDSINTGSYNTTLGYQAGQAITTGEYNTLIGRTAGINTTGTGNTYVGGSVAYNKTSGNNNTIIGYRAGLNSGTGAGCVFIGTSAGANETGDNKLYIANTTTATPLIYGEFDNEIVNVNGKLKPNSITVDDEGLSAAGDYGPGAEIWYEGTSTPSAGFCYYLDSTGGWTAAQANASGTATGMLAVSAGTDSDVDGMVLRGFVQISNTLTGSVGDAVYLETSAAGRFTTTKPTGAGNFVRLVGYLAKGTNVIYFNPSPEWEAL